MSAEALMAGEAGTLPLPWLAEPLSQVLARQKGHALLLHGAVGNGVLPFVISLAQAWLCESDARRPCGRCGSCKLLQAKLHPDLQMLLPETLRRELDWPLRSDKPDKSEGEDTKRKPSKQIRIDEVRDAIDAMYRTSARGRGKVLVLHPAEAINAQAANALLKTLEEPPPGTRIVLASADPSLLLPTVRSRCQVHRLAPPAHDAAVAWLQGQGVADAQVLLAACSGQPLAASAMAAAGLDAARWRALPAALAQGQPGALKGWPLPQVLDALHKVCHDAMVLASGVQGGHGLYFPAGSVPATASLEALAAWSRELGRVARHDEHPWNESLMLDALLAAAARALRTAPARAGAGRFVTLHP